MNQNDKSNVNLSNSTENGVKLSDKAGNVGPTGSSTAKDSKENIWNQNQNNKHKVKSNNNDDDKKSSKDIDPKKTNQNGSSPSDTTSVGGVGSGKIADVKSKNKIGGVSGGKANTTTQSNGPSSNPR